MHDGEAGSILFSDHCFAEYTLLPIAGHMKHEVS